jgi:hypothetical protein
LVINPWFNSSAAFLGEGQDCFGDLQANRPAQYKISPELHCIAVAPGRMTFMEFEKIKRFSSTHALE